jgi:hypothetical protein
MDMGHGIYCDKLVNLEGNGEREGGRDGGGSPERVLWHIYSSLQVFYASSRSHDKRYMTHGSLSRRDRRIEKLEIHMGQLRLLMEKRDDQQVSIVI